MLEATTATATTGQKGNKVVSGDRSQLVATQRHASVLVGPSPSFPRAVRKSAKAHLALEGSLGLRLTQLLFAILATTPLKRMATCASNRGVDGHFLGRY